MLSIHLRFGHPSGLFPSGSPTNNLYTFLFSPIHATCPIEDLIGGNISGSGLENRD
jgi:hypothetical protein